jgi:hypothetical protein
MFSIDPGSASITTNDMLDREFMDVHYLRVVAALEDQPQLSATTTLQVHRFICIEIAFALLVRTGTVPIYVQ